MFTATSQTAGGEKRGQNSVPVTISEHAQERWAERTPAETPLTAAWGQSIPVEAPDVDCTAARLYPPYDALLVVKHATVTTVLHNDGRLNTPGLVECSACDSLRDPVDADTCPWCDAEHTGAVRPGQVTLTRGDL